MDNRYKLKVLFKDVFKGLITTEEICELSQSNFSDWDSLNHLNLIIAIEDEFDLDISPEEMVVLNSFERIYEYIGNVK